MLSSRNSVHLQKYFYLAKIKVRVGNKQAKQSFLLVSG